MMNPTRDTQRRQAGVASLKALVTSVSVAAVLGGCGLLGAAGQTEATATTVDPAQTEAETQSQVQPPAQGFQPGRPRHSHGGEAPGLFNFGADDTTDSGADFALPLPRTQSSR